eukprot:jgi/Phyca11/537341/estExt2_fgenesh1_pg.C_PHYCAscaffold_840040
METTWRNEPLVDASGSLTPGGAQLLEKELGEERLAVVTLVGPPSTRAARGELVAKLLQEEEAVVSPSTSHEALVLLASVAYVEEDFQVLILDVDVTEDEDSGLQQLVGAFCALSSLVISSYDKIGSTRCLASFLPQFQSLFQTLVGEFASMIVFEMLPKLLSIDWSPSRSLQDKLTGMEEQQKVARVEALESLVRFKKAGICYARSIAEMNFESFCGAHATVKRLFGLEMTGEMLGALLRKLSAQILEQDPLDFGTAWDDFVEDKCLLLAGDALNMYVDCVHPSVLEDPPMELATFKQLHEEIWRLKFDKQFNEKARGPEKAAVLRDFYQCEAIQAFQQLENVVTQQLSESRLEELRLKLEKDFADKKDALVEHFKQEEAQMRAGMARDMETMQKMHEAKAARVKIDGSETKRLRDELNDFKRQNAELREKAIVLEHAQQDASNQKAVLAAKVEELELAVHREMANRTELVETLALTIKTAEEKERTLNTRIDELQRELGEKTFRVEGELQDLTQQLRKTNEEKEELQKKLNEFFLKVTALPETLQQHLFCMESDGQVDFADALTSYMS